MSREKQLPDCEIWSQGQGGAAVKRVVIAREPEPGPPPAGDVAVNLSAGVITEDRAFLPWCILLRPRPAWVDVITAGCWELLWQGPVPLGIQEMVRAPWAPGGKSRRPARSESSLQADEAAPSALAWGEHGVSSRPRFCDPPVKPCSLHS